MADQTLPIFVSSVPLHLRPRWLRRLRARYRLWRIATRREICLSGLDRRQRLDIGRPTPQRYRWLEELTRRPY